MDDSAFCKVIKHNFLLVCQVKMLQQNALNACGTFVRKRRIKFEKQSEVKHLVNSLCIINTDQLGIITQNKN